MRTLRMRPGALRGDKSAFTVCVIYSIDGQIELEDTPAEYVDRLVGCSPG